MEEATCVALLQEETCLTALFSLCNYTEGILALQQFFRAAWKMHPNLVDVEKRPIKK